ncbi:unnamed protein product [Schistosoma turkestanicum]|nr:unnamed protein product [Schistosoma turkestanicum]
MNFYDKDESAVAKIKSILEKRKERFVFGSCQERLLYPEALPNHRFGITLSKINANELVGPATYDTQNSIHRDFNKKGAIIGTGEARIMDSHLFNAYSPDPGAYQNIVDKSLSVKPNKVPFNHSAPRTNKFLEGASTVGPGIYDVTQKTGQHVQWQMDTMLRPVNLPVIKQESTIPINTIKLPTTTQSKRYQRKLEYMKLYF